MSELLPPEDWAMELHCSTQEVTPCTLYETEREIMSRADKQGQSVFWSPYLALTPKERKRLANEVYPTVYGKSLAELTSNRPDAQILADVELHLSRRSATSGPGRTAFLHRMRSNLRALGAYRILKHYAWNRLPSTSHNLYTNQREWQKAQRRAEALIRHFSFLLMAICGRPYKEQLTEEQEAENRRASQRFLEEDNL